MTWRLKRALLLQGRKACGTNLFQGSALPVTACSEKARNHREWINEPDPGIMAQIFPG
jgi:hypothetical protein